MKGTKPFSISKQWVYDAYRKVASNRGSGGVDGVSLKEFSQNYKNYPYILWNYYPVPGRYEGCSKKRPW